MAGAALAATLLVATGGLAQEPAARGAPAGEAVLEIVEFSDFECPYCARAVPVLDDLLARHGDAVRVVYRHFPLPVHPHAARAARAAEEARRQGAFWPYHDLLFRHQDRLTDVDLVGYADSLGLDTEAFRAVLASDAHAGTIEADVRRGRGLGVSGTPTFYVNGYRLVGVPPPWVLEEALRAFRAGRVERRDVQPPGRR